MKITVKDSIKKIPFHKIGVGECFSYEFDDYYICIEACTSCGMSINAVELSTGLTCHFDEDDKVVPLTNAELIIK